MSDGVQNASTPGDAGMEAEILPPDTSHLSQEFPELIECAPCKRPYRTQQLRTHVNTLLTEIALSCHRCKKVLIQMRLKDWYDHYIQGQPHQFDLDRHGFVHKDPRDIYQPPAPKPNPFDEMLKAGANHNRPSSGPNRPNRPNNSGQGQRDGGRPSSSSNRNRNRNRNRRSRSSGRRPS